MSVSDGPCLLGVVGSTATGKSALALELARIYDGEIISCDSTAVYRGLDIGTDKPPSSARRAVPHHLLDRVGLEEQYTAARFAREAGETAHDIVARGRLPIVVGGTGFYYRALTRGLFPGPGRDPALRARLEARARARGVEWLHRLVARVDPPSGRRIQPRDEMRLVRALEVYFLTGRPLSAHFARTRSPIAGFRIATLAVRLDSDALRARVADRVERQFDAGVVDEVRGALARGVPADAPALRGLVYRQIVEWLRGERNEAETRALIVRENLRYARRQLIWFRKEPNLQWIDGPGEASQALARARHAIGAAWPERA